MNYQVTPRIRTLVAELHDLRGVVELYLNVASRSARQEWDKLVARIPPQEQLDRGVSAVSDSDLEQMINKVSRFCEILRGGNQSPPEQLPPVTEWRLMSRKPS